MGGEGVTVHNYMKYLVIIPDGIADHALDELGGKTPLEVARVPNLDAFAKMGKIGTAKFVPDRLAPATHVAVFSLFGYDPRKYATGPGPLEAANLEIKLEPNEIAFRMDLVTESEGVLADAAAGHISTKEAKALIAFLNKKLSSEFARFFAGHENRHIAVIKDSRGFEALSAATVAPQAVVGKKWDQNLPKGPGEDSIKKLMYDARLLLQDHEVNQVRVDLGENPANMIWLWGQGVAPKLPKFSETFGGITGAVVSPDEVVKGFARLIGLTVAEMASGSASPTFDYEREAELVLELLKEKDFVCVHVKTAANAALQGDVKQKTLSLEAIDHYFIGTAKSFYESHKDTRILIAPLLNTPAQARAHVRGSVPFILAGKNIMADEFERFRESTAQLSSFRFQDGSQLIEALMSGK